MQDGCVSERGFGANKANCRRKPWNDALHTACTEKHIKHTSDVIAAPEITARLLTMLHATAAPKQHAALAVLLLLGLLSASLPSVFSDVNAHGHLRGARSSRHLHQGQRGAPGPLSARDDLLSQASPAKAMGSFYQRVYLACALALLFRLRQAALGNPN